MGDLHRPIRAGSASCLRRPDREVATDRRRNMTASPRNFIDRVFFGYQNTATLKAALELDVFTAIGKDVLDADALAAKCDAAPGGIAAMCDSLVVMGFLTKSGAGYALEEDTAVFLDRASPACIAGIHEFLAAPEFVQLVF